jgi:cell wall-associated NlpC family hydrolase
MQLKIQKWLRRAPVFLTWLISSSAALAYDSPYKVDFQYPIDQLYAADNQAPRNNPRLESKTAYEDWYSERIRRKFGAWGPEPRRYPALDGFETIPAEWKRQRVLAVACRLIGLPYQHHHLPDWDPPKQWPWKPVAYGRNSKGLDCSDFTSWLYNYGLGIHLPTGIDTQAQTEHLRGPGGEGFIHTKVIVDDAGYTNLISKMQTGDLLYIKNKAGRVSHVIMWVGACGKSPDRVPLVIDCTGPDHLDCNGNSIPIGVQLRPFNKNSWYYESFSHAHRIIGQPLEPAE